MSGSAQKPRSLAEALAPAVQYRIRLTDGTAFLCGATERILVAMRRGGQRGLPVGCRRGGCGVCRVRIHEGAYRTDPMSAAYVSADEQAEGYALSCCVYPQSDLVVEPAPKPCAPKRLHDPLDSRL